MFPFVDLFRLVSYEMNNKNKMNSLVTEDIASTVSVQFQLKLKTSNSLVED